jgi:hypothetical protein
MPLMEIPAFYDEQIQLGVEYRPTVASEQSEIEVWCTEDEYYGGSSIPADEGPEGEMDTQEP